MRRPVGSTDVTPSGGTVTLIGRRGEGWAPITDSDMSLAEAVELIPSDIGAAIPDGPLVAAGRGPFFAEGTTVSWHYGRIVDMAKVVRDDERGLVAWIPSGSRRLSAVPLGGSHPRDMPLEQRFSAPWRIVEREWTGAGVLRIAPTGKPWSVWFFRDGDGEFTGTYVNLELPHQRPAPGSAAPHRVHSTDLVLDLWMDAGPEGDEDVWLKDEDELQVAVTQGRLTEQQEQAVRIFGEHACREVLAPSAWPMDEGWQEWQPTADFDEPIPLPDNQVIRWWRQRSGDHSLDG